MPNMYFWAGNEPDLQTPALFVFAGNEFAYLTQEWIQKVVPYYYTEKPSGIPGNDDYGTMSSWVVLWNLGLFPITSSKYYALSVPFFDEITVSIPKSELIVKSF